MSAKNKCYNNLCIVVTLASDITFGLMVYMGFIYQFVVIQIILRSVVRHEK